MGALKLAIQKCTPHTWMSTNKACDTYTVTNDVAVEIHRRLASVHEDTDADSILDLTASDFPEVVEESQGTFLYRCFHSESLLTFRHLRNIQPHDVVVDASIRYSSRYEPIDDLGRQEYHRMRDSYPGDALIDEIVGNTALATPKYVDITISLVFRPLRGWSRVRHVPRERLGAAADGVEGVAAHEAGAQARHPRTR